MNSIWLIISELANQRARKVLFTCEVYTNNDYVYIYLKVACQISNFLFLMKILHITGKKTISLAVRLVLQDRNPFYAKRKPFRSNNVLRVSRVYMTKYLFFPPPFVDNL